MGVHPLVSWNDFLPWQFQGNFQEKRSQMFQDLLRFKLWNSDNVVSAADYGKAVDKPNPDSSIREMNSASFREKLQRICGHIYCTITVSLTEVRGLCPDQRVSLKTCFPSGDHYSTKHFCKLFLLAQLSKSCCYDCMSNLSIIVSLGLLLCCSSQIVSSCDGSPTLFH